MAKYKVLTGIDYPPNRRAEAGDIVDDLPPKAIKWLRECDAIVLLDGAEPEEVAVEVVVDETPEGEAE